MKINIRLATPEDSNAITAIYAPIVAETTISFEYDTPDVNDIRARIEKTLKHYPWLVCSMDEFIVGYAYAGAHRNRTAYQWSTEVSAYVHADYRRRGVAGGLYTSLFNLLVLQGYYNAYAGITMPNPPSVHLHEAVGFTQIGVYKNVGYKQGAWHDVTWWECCLQAYKIDPLPPQPINAIMGTPAAVKALQSGILLMHS